MSNTCEDQVSLIGHTPIMKQLVNLLERVAESESTVLITGPTGSGKELVARTIHQKSKRARAPFIDVNCSALPDTLIEAELFGYQRGTFSGAGETRSGLFEVASSGTLFLDEVDALSPAAQAKLLRVLQERKVRRLGARENIPVDVRIISATNRDLKQSVGQGTFRADLLYRLHVVPVRAPELREHKEDIPSLIDHFLQRITHKRAETARYFSREAMRALSNYDWPGNVRELENAVEYAYTMGTGEELGLSDLPLEVVKNSPEKCDVLTNCLQREVTLAEAERNYILWMFERCGRHHIKTASKLGVDRRTLYRKLQQYGARVLDH
jgi:DNA-binding NtrC family response regulator